MLKLFFWLLIAANGVLLAFRMGYMDSFLATKSESQRMENQLNADKIKLVVNSKPPVASAASATSAGLAPSVSASASVPASMPLTTSSPQATKPPKLIPCTEVGDFETNDTKKIEARLAELALGDRQAKRSIQQVASHMVYIPPKRGKEGADKKARELKEMGIKNFFIIQDNSKMRWGISLGVFKTEAAAKNHLANLKKQGVRSARIGTRSVTGTRVAYSLRDLDEKSLKSLKEIMEGFPEQKARECGKE